MVKRILLSLSTVLIATVNANAATTLSLGDTFMSASNLALNQSTAGITAANTADTLNNISFEMRSDSPVDNGKGVLVNIKYDGMTANTTTSVNNSSLAVLTGMQFYNEQGNYLSVQGRVKETNYPVMGYNTVGLGANATGVYNLGSLKAVGILDFDNQNGPASKPTASYNLLTTTLMLGGSPWGGGSVYVGPSVSMLSNSVSPIVSGILSVSQKMGNLTGSLSYVYQSKAGATGNVILVGVNYSL